MPSRSGSFAGGTGAWLDRLGGLRNFVRQELVSRQLAEQLAGRTAQRVLDIGCGQGTQALRLARAGHYVTGIDSDPVAGGGGPAGRAPGPPRVGRRRGPRRGARPPRAGAGGGG
ncbi:class I SAM-dependent methyltransferase, partial [Kitasatospora sp. NPDC059803]|uniref:class I SAM-dependent methyltransferase n=1 Tax=Kitasatospora sp. NPDC059803 TaxID=3346953 RepID=UPI003653B84D